MNVAAEDLIGTWRQRSISVEGGRPSRTQAAVWVQAGRRFGDVRAPLPEAEAQTAAFTGEVELDGDRIRFHHELDHDDRTATMDDHSTLELRGATLYERGPIDAPAGAGFEEIWDRVGGPGPFFVCDAATADGTLGARLVCVGEQATIHVAGRSGSSTLRCTAASWWTREVGRWERRSAIGRSELVPCDDPATFIGRASDELLAWRTVEEG